MQENLYVVIHLDGETFEVVNKAQVWILQQRVADRKIREYAKKHNLTAAESKPLLAEYKGVKCWVLLHKDKEKAGFIVCPIRPEAEMDYVKYNSIDFMADFPAFQRHNAEFDYEQSGLYFKAISWLEFEPVIAKEDAEVE